MNILQLPIKRSTAKNIGSTYYFTGKECKNGHISERQTSNGTCVECNRGYSLNHYKRNSEIRIGYVKRYQKSNRGKVKKWAKRTYINNKDAYYFRARLRQTLKIQRTPLWLTREHFAEIKKVREEAKFLESLTGIIFYVDHIVPLKSDIVCGLHVPWNLQILTAAENLAKSNKLLPEYT